MQSLTADLRKVDTALTKRETATQEAAAQQQAAQEAAQAAASEQRFRFERRFYKRCDACTKHV